MYVRRCCCVVVWWCGVWRVALMQVELSRDRNTWAIKRRSKNYSASRTFLRERSMRLRFMILARDLSNESMRQIIKVTGDVSETVPLSYEQHAPSDLVTRPGWAKRLLKPVVVEIGDDAVPQERVSEKPVESVTKRQMLPRLKLKEQIIEVSTQRFEQLSRFTTLQCCKIWKPRQTEPVLWKP